MHPGDSAQGIFHFFRAVFVATRGAAGSIPLRTLAVSIAASAGAEPRLLTVPTLADTVRVVRDRLPDDLQKAPMATTEVPASVLRDNRQLGLDESLQFVPGALAQSRSGGQDVRITIRGFGARGAGDRSNAGTTRGIRVLLDGFPITEPDGRTSLDFADLGAVERIRVVRSNTSALFGSASGGLIELSTMAPFRHAFGETRASFGSFGLQKWNARGGVPLGNGRMRLSLSDTRFDGWRQNSELQNTTFQASLVSHPATHTTLEVALAATSNKTHQPGALTRSEMDADPRQADPTYASQRARRENTLGRVGVRIKQEIGRSRDFQVGGFVEPKSLHRSERNRFRDFTRIHLGANALYGHDFEFAPGVRARWTAGVDEAFQDGAVLFYNIGPGGTRGTELRANQREAIHSFGAFTEMDVQPTQNWAFALGGRFDLAQYISEDFIEPHLGDRRNLEHLSPRFSASYRFRKAHTTYAALSGGIEAPAFNEIDPPAPFDTLTSLNPFLEPARSLTLEVGAKGLFLLTPDGRNLVRYDVAVYGLEVRNDLVPFAGGAYYATAGKSRRAGIELGGELATGAGIGLRAAAAFTHNEYVEYRNNFGDFGGNETAGLPNVTFDFKASYDSPVGAYVESSVAVRDDYFADDANSTSAHVAAFATWDATVGVRREIGRTQCQAFLGVSNLLDTRYVASAFINGTNGRFFEPGMERNLHFGLNVRYD